MEFHGGRGRRRRGTHGVAHRVAQQLVQRSDGQEGRLRHLDLVTEATGVPALSRAQIHSQPVQVRGNVSTVLYVWIMVGFQAHVYLLAGSFLCAET